MNTDEATIGELCDLTGDSLPDDWTIAIVISRGCLGVELCDPNGFEVEVDDGEDAELPSMILRRVNHARDKDGLMPVDWFGRHDPEV